MQMSRGTFSHKRHRKMGKNGKRSGGGPVSSKQKLIRQMEANKEEPKPKGRPQMFESFEAMRQAEKK